jgi:Rap guanine nucleotide exchange factor 4
MWQALLEEGAITHGRNQNMFVIILFIQLISVSQEHCFKDKYLFYRFSGDENGVLIRPDISADQNESDEQLNDVILTLTQVGPDAMLRMILRKP